MVKKHKERNILEHKIYNLIRTDDINDIKADLVDGVLMFLVLASVVVAFINTFEISTSFQNTLTALETLFVVLFSVEYAMRVWTAELIYPHLSPWKARLRYMFTPMAIIDLLSIVPFYLPLVGVRGESLKLIRLVRLLRVFKINRYTSSLTLIWIVLKTRATQIISSVMVIVVLMFMAAMVMYDIEHLAQPDKFDNALSAMWWAMATITTVGYGDIYPITTLGRVLGAFITFMGIALTAIPTGIISAGFIEQSNLRKKEKNSEMFCSQCGQTLPKHTH